MIGNPVRVNRNGIDALFRMEEGEQIRAGAHDLIQAFDNGLQQMRSQELQGVPNQHAVELKVIECDGVLKKSCYLGRIGLVLIEIAIAKTVVQLMQKIVRVKTMAVIRQEADGRLICSRKIEDAEPRTVLKGRAELIEPVTVPRLEAFSACAHRRQPPSQGWPPEWQAPAAALEQEVRPGAELPYGRYRCCL